jgi:hypothetical protein
MSLRGALLRQRKALQSALVVAVCVVIWILRRPEQLTRPYVGRGIVHYQELPRRRLGRGVRTHPGLSHPSCERAGGVGDRDLVHAASRPDVRLRACRFRRHRPPAFPRVALGRPYDALRDGHHDGPRAHQSRGLWRSALQLLVDHPLAADRSRLEARSLGLFGRRCLSSAR